VRRTSASSPECTIICRIRTSICASSGSRYLPAPDQPCAIDWRSDMPRFNGMPAAVADGYRGGSLDAYGNAPERQISDGDAPCRCCLNLIPAGNVMLVLAYRPFETLQPYAETGPVFLCADACKPPVTGETPACLVSPKYLLKGYSIDERIVYGTGQITALNDIGNYADQILAREDVEFVDLRSARNNCWQSRLTSN
jgi:hypothetical protein